MPAGAEQYEQCLSGYYCPGADNITIDANNNQGIVKCPNDYPYSDAGVAANAQCYKDCTSDDVANAMTVVGRNYYGDGKDTCKVTDCVSGWHVKPGLNLEELVGSTYEGSNSSYMAGTNSAYINNAGDFVEYGQYEEYGQEYYGISENNSFAVVYDDDKGMITGRARCSSQSENSVENLPDESGNADATNCYCTIDSYTPVDGTKQTVSAPWIKYGSINWYPGACESNCVQNCATYMREYMHLDFRGKMFEAAYELPVCSVNQININWNLGYGDNNVSTTTCSYTDVIESPTDPVRPGYTFAGWKLVE
ncbi:MAG: InlB B-repeat-containing protein [Alphaproteobacteria bacterium]|nr:InlB B-repeat-containing protein [Alphaproteobacteria bacterium]